MSTKLLPFAEFMRRRLMTSSVVRATVMPGPGYACSCGKVPCDPEATEHLLVLAEAEAEPKTVQQ